MKTNKVLGIIAMAMVAGLLLFMVFASSLWKWVPAGNVAIVYNANTGIDRNRVLKPGRYTLSPLDRLIVSPTHVVAAFYTEDPALGERQVADGIEITTKQGTVVFDVYVLYRVQQDMVWNVFDNFATKPIEEIQSTRIRREVKTLANQVAGQFFLDELIGPRRAEANKMLAEKLEQALHPLGFKVEDAAFVTAHPGPNLAKQFVSIETAEIYRQISAIKAQVAEKHKQIALTKSQAEAKAAELIAAAATEKSNTLLQLEIDKIEAERWDGSKIKVDTSGLTSVMFDPSFAKGGR